jgi:hypothetical protein
VYAGGKRGGVDEPVTQPGDSMRSMCHVWRRMCELQQHILSLFVIVIVVDFLFMFNYLSYLKY